MKLPQMMPKKKLRATAARRAPARAIEDEEEEPTMRFSSAFVIVLLLHFVAIGGIYTFESIKVHRHPETTPTPSTKSAEPAANKAATTTAATTTAATTTTTTSKHPTGDLLAASVRATDSDAAKKTAISTAAHMLRESGTVHVVAKGENPRAIAKKYGVSYDDLLKFNKVEDARKLQIGQKLQIPAKPRG